MSKVSWEAALDAVRNALDTPCSEHFRALAEKCVESAEALMHGRGGEAEVLAAASAMMTDRDVREYGAVHKKFSGQVYGAAHLATAAVWKKRGLNNDCFLRFCL